MPRDGGWAAGRCFLSLFPFMRQKPLLLWSGHSSSGLRAGPRLPWASLLLYSADMISFPLPLVPIGHGHRSGWHLVAGGGVLRCRVQEAWGLEEVSLPYVYSQAVSSSIDRSTAVGALRCFCIWLRMLDTFSCQVLPRSKGAQRKHE